MTEPSDSRGVHFDEDAARKLVQQARLGRARAYAPYSGFQVGAALLGQDGSVFTGVNVENASLGLSTCAERTAVVSAIAAGVRDFTAIAVVGPDDGVPCPPCGSCRQILHEADPHLLIVLQGAEGGVTITPLSALLPSAFGGSTLRPRQSP